MISFEMLVVAMPELDREELERWIAEDWVRPDRAHDGWMFSDIDVARLRLIRELLQDLGLAEDAMPVVLRLLDQLYDARRRLRRVRIAVERTGSFEARQAMRQVLAATPETTGLHRRGNTR
jgi:chaperone modulatory protein CbpM